MPSLPEDVQSPLLQSFFTRKRDALPLVLDISRLLEEKPPLPQIVVTPSTPQTEERPFEYPFGRLKVHPDFDEDDFDDEDASFLHETSPIQTKWRALVPVRTLRITCVLGVILGLVAVHLFIFQPEAFTE